MPETPQNFGECETWADVIRRQELRFEAEGVEKPRKALIALAGIKNEQNVRRWGPVINEIGGEHPNLGMVLTNFRHWPEAMQNDVLAVLLSGSRRAIQLLPTDGDGAPAAGGVQSGDLMLAALDVPNQATQLVRMAYEMQRDGVVTPAESSDLATVGEAAMKTIKTLIQKTIYAATCRTVRGSGGRL